MLLVVLLALVGGAARTVSAASTTINVAASQQPKTTATLSTTDQTTYVSYSLTFTSAQSSWTHVVLRDGAPTVDGVASTQAKTVFVGGCPSPPTLDGGGFSCSIDKLSPSTSPLTINVVVQTPTSGATLAVNPTLTGDEGSGTPGKTDIFPSHLSWTLSGNTTTDLSSFTNPGNKVGNAAFSTDKHLSASGNPQWTQADVPNGIAPLGVLVSLQERNFATGDCPSFVSKASLSCFGQISSITVDPSGSGGPFSSCSAATSASNCLGFSVRVAATSLSFKLNYKKGGIFHNGVLVPPCSSGTTDGSGDCVVSFAPDPLTGDPIWSVRGPSNGNWGGFG
jgi:hypothetical protein